MISKTDPLPVALIGCGNFARQQHLPWLGRFDHARLTCVCDSDAAAAAAAAERFGAESSCTDWRSVAGDPGVAAGVVAVRDEFQAEIAEGLLLAGKHVYVEKPGAVSEAEFGRLIRARDRSGRLAAVGFQKRFSPAYRAVRDLFASAGPPRTFFCRMADDAWRWAKGYPPGALLRHDACHLFDLLRFFTGSEVRTLYAVSGHADEDALLLQFENGATATLLLSGHASMDFPKERLEAFPERGAVTMDDFVEVRCYGFPDFPALQTFPLLNAETGLPVGGAPGLEAFRTLRREAWLAWREAGGVPEVIPNFLRDQGWSESLSRFVSAVQKEEPDIHATLEDARAAARIAWRAEAARSGAQLQAGEVKLEP